MNILQNIDITIGGVALRQQRSKGTGTILLYHRVSPVQDLIYPPVYPDVFAEQCDLLSQNFSVISLSEMVSRIQKKQSVRGCATITFDDGYEDFAEFAYPILKKHNFHSTHFLVSQCVQSGHPTWNWRLEYLLSRREELPIELQQFEADLGQLRADEREKWLHEREIQLKDISMPAMMDYAQIKKLDADLVEWGSHTVSHAMLGLCSDKEAEKEMRQSKSELETLLDIPIRALSYPNNSYNRRTPEIARECGYTCAAAVEQRNIISSSPIWALPRFDITASSSRLWRMEVSGTLENLRRVRSKIRS